MLKLVDIKKRYIAGDLKVDALKGVSVQFRKSEFVSILGPSGCGKTTLLNIIGGLDHYSSGDLIIDDISTKNYSDRDWDTYRNHRVGFVFQSYNLIPHQTVLENVELALTISGMEKSERIKKAKQTLDKVGLKDQYNKKPNQLSGGQCQRVAIARALVNDPEILLADEPTGALDTVTSVQIMDLIKEIANDCLVIMVTHNPELAEKYSTRIIKLLDGEMISDSNPYDGSKEEETKKSKKRKSKKSKLSFWSAFKLSAKNLWSKFKRTLMVCLAGSIGIIGVATVLAVSSGVQGFINNMQNDMLSGNPISISEEAINMSALMEASTNAMTKEAVEKSIEDGYIKVDYMIEYLVERSGGISSMRVSNDISSEYIDFIKAMPEEYYATIHETYGINILNNLYTDFKFNNQANNNISLSTAMQMYTSMLNSTEYKEFSQLISSLSESFIQAPNDEDFILSQYEFVTDSASSKIATEANEIMIVVNDDSTLSDLLLAQLGYYSQDEFFNIMYKAVEDDKYNEALWKDKFSYEELVGKTFTWYPNNTIFNKTDENSPLAEINPFTYNAYEDSTWATGKELKITAILKPKADISYGSLDSGLYYTSALAKEIIQDSLTSEIVKYLVDNEKEAFESLSINGTNQGITYNYSFSYNDKQFDNQVGFIGSTSQANALIGSMTGQTMPNYYTITLRELGGKELPNKIEIYPTDFNYKDSVTEYLDKWNNEGDLVVNGKTLTKEQRSEIEYTDNLELVINLVNNLINMVTYALVAFTALSLVVSTVMVAIITYVSVIERIKEIGVIRSLGGRKRDVSRLFVAETFIIGSVSGILGIGITYGITAILNLIIRNLAGIPSIASLSIPTALIMIAISIVLTLISGLIPASLAAKKDPVVALKEN